jgi:hypothetical protein
VKIPFLLQPMGTHKGTVLARLLMPDGRTLVECREQWLHRDHDRKIWGRYVAESGEAWWFDHSRVQELKETSKGKRKAFLVEIETIDPPPEGAICAVATSR